MDVKEAAVEYLPEAVPQTSKGEVPPGYKRTEVGVIPEDWSIQPLDSIASVASGKRLPLGSSLTDHETPHPYVRVVDMRVGTVSLDDIRFVPVDVFPSIKRYRIWKHDIFISVAGTLGIVGKVPDVLNGANLTENADRITNIECSQGYLLNVLASPLIQNTIETLRTVGAQPKLALERIRKFTIPLPPTKTEQRAIAEALSDADALIAALQRLIAKKRAIKQGTMQALLTGRQRLPGFTGEWETKRLGDVATFHKGKGLPKSVLDEHGQFPCVHYGELFLRLPETVHQTISRTNWSENALQSVANDVLMPTSDVTPSGLATASCVISGGIIIGGDILVIRAEPDQFSGSYLSRVIRNSKDQVLQLVTGTTVFHLYASDMKNFEFQIPEASEQYAIVEALADTDAEIEALEARLTKTRQLKAGMMQQLLTGRIRLPLEATA